ncbi:cation diffusion facilitator family transporter [Fructilactobacillus fructivorans]|uniref:cation diffusion facilitator family transporter n=1 Tax=Fructilactobacillus fructivorans TaxID=1614 RepID=UPI000704B22A|nr:cation diffusion facilitator family transporter [Fructilactobacillus fructivorans]KRN12141.1 cation diffusion facilitator family transporter [Fructilactobacillus fructivorans]
MNNDQLSGMRFFEVTVLNAVITILEFLGGIFSGSLSLLSDAFHNLGDSISIVLSYIAHRISKKQQTKQNTYGFKRAEIISAFLNSLFLILISIFLIIEAISRISHPETIDGPVMLGVAIVGTIANFVSAFLLNKGAKHNLNMKATYLHLLSDSLSSFGIIFGGILISFFNWTIVDPIVTILVALYIMWESWPIIKKTVGILMGCAPNLNYAAIKKDLLKINGVTSVHHVHAMMVDENSIVFSAHVNMKDMPLSQVQLIYDQINKLLKGKYHIDHVTIQPEVDRGRHDDLFYDNGKDI